MLPVAGDASQRTLLASYGKVDKIFPFPIKTIADIVIP